MVCPPEPAGPYRRDIIAGLCRNLSRICKSFRAFFPAGGLRTKVYTFSTRFSTGKIWVCICPLPTSFCGAWLPRRAHEPRYSVGRHDPGAPKHSAVGAAICRPPPKEPSPGGRWLAEGQTDEGGPGDVSGPTHRSAPTGYHGVMLSKAKHPFSPSLFRRQGPGDGFFGLQPQNDRKGEVVAHYPGADVPIRPRSVVRALPTPSVRLRRTAPPSRGS